MRTEKHLFTKDEARKLLSLWESNTIQQIGAELGLNNNQVVYLAQRMRDAGIKLARKHVNGNMISMLKELKAELDA